ncbi:MAG: Ig-like domain-containing protein, partial [Treponema sp.]|nr:Ig-like domain-containing protein [Treponema sp.]MCL2273075.1 Ig-like domain-containing protein [Treponema sp.]
MKKINKYLGFIILAVLTGLLLTGCSGIPSIRTDYNIASMLAGSSLQLKTSSSKIVWSVSSTSDGTGSVANGTTIAQNGLLTASINEPALSLYVRATNKKDKFNILQVRIVTVTSVTVSPENQTVVAGRNVQFKANVTGNNNPDSAVTWKVSSNAAGTGTVTSGTSVNSSGVLTVAAKESNSTLYVIATSRIDPSKSGSTAATVVIPAITDISVSPVNQSVIAGRTLNFNASVTGTYEPDSTVTWKVSSNPAGTGAVSPGTSISSNGTLTVDTHETITTLFITATSTYDPSKSGSASVTVLVPTVTNVAVTPLNQTITAGSTLQFNATVTGTNSPNTSVTWKVDSTGTGVIAAGTNINTNGLLSVSAGETSNVLYITATSVQDPTKTMSVIVSILIPTVTGVSVSPTGQTVERGGRIQFNSAVTGTNNPSQNVTWRVSSNAAGTGAVTAGTSISADGLLTVSENETSSPLFIFAASAVNPFVAGNAFVNVNIPSATLPGVVIPTVTNVAVSPSAQSTLTNRTLQFSASVTGTNNPDNAVTWRVSSNAAGSGSVTAGTSINSSGTLTIAANESLSTLYVIAASVIDPSRTGIATVTVTNASSNVTVTDVIVSPAAQSTVTNRTLQFSATVTGSNNPSTAVTWKVSPNTAGTGSVTSGTSINSNGLLTISANETLTTLYVIATSVADSSKSGRATVTISASTSVPSVTSVSVSPSSRTMDRGTSSQFSASVTGANNPDTSVTWRVSSNAAGTSSATSGTSINSSGSLTVSANETLTTLYVIATSVADTSKSGSATVTVNIPAPTVTSVTVSPSSRTMERNTT